MKSATLRTLGLGVLAAALAGLPGPAGAQTVGFGASPGRAAYRPASQWNDGPYFTTPHVDPYAPRRGVDTGLIYSRPLGPPYGLTPHGSYEAFDPGRGAVGPYAQGFSPYSGYAPWYRREYRFTPTRNDVVRARGQFFRTAPVPPAGVLPPLPPPVQVAPPEVVQAPPTQAPPTAVAPATPLRAGRRNRGVVIYRSGLDDGR